MAVKWFDRLDEVAQYRNSEDLRPGQLSNFAPEEGLPYFSVPRSGYPILDNLIEWLKHSIVFILSDENHELEIDWSESEQAWVAVDVMALLCEAYSFCPSVTAQRVDVWKQKMIALWKAWAAEDSMGWNENDALYKNVIARFDSLKTLAEKYPPWFA